MATESFRISPQLPPFIAFPDRSFVLKPFLSGGDFKEDQYPVILNISS